MCNNFSSSGNLVVFVIGHLGHILCMGYIFLISTRHHLSFSLNYSPNQKKIMHCIPYRSKNIYIFNLWTQKPLPAIRAICSRSQKALVEQWGSRAIVKNTQLLPWFSKHQSEISLFWREAPARRKGKFGPSPGWYPGSKWDIRILLLQNTLLYRQESKTTEVYVAIQTSLSNTN